MTSCCHYRVWPLCQVGLKAWCSSWGFGQSPLEAVMRKWQYYMEQQIPCREEVRVDEWVDQIWPKTRLSDKKMCHSTRHGQTRPDLNWLHRTIQVPALLFALSCFGFHHRWFVSGNSTTRCHFLFDFSTYLHKLKIHIKTFSQTDPLIRFHKFVMWGCPRGQWVQSYWSLSLLAEFFFYLFY